MLWIVYQHNKWYTKKPGHKSSVKGQIVNILGYVGQEAVVDIYVSRPIWITNKNECFAI